MQIGDKFKVNKTIATIVHLSKCDYRFALCDVHSEHGTYVGQFVFNIQKVTERDKL